MNADSEPLSAAAGSPDQLRACIAGALEAVRARTHALTSCDEAELVKQHSPLMSPLVWDLAHVGSQEELWLVRDVGGRQALRPDIDQMYDAFEHPRSSRPSLPLLSPEHSRRYIGEVRDKALEVLEQSALEGPALIENGFAFGMIIQHEHQHDETMLATHQLREGPPVLAPEPVPAGTGPSSAEHLPHEVPVPAGPFTMGTSLEPWALDNERPAHQVDLPAFWIDTVPVTNGAYRRFIDADGYQDPQWWSGPGWQHRMAAGLEAPLYWVRDGQGWYRRRFGVFEPVPDAEPVQHVCWYEAEAYARWAGRRLPTEAEWEKAARWDPASGRSHRYPWGEGNPLPSQANLGGKTLRPAVAGSYPAGASATGARQLIGDVWEWVASEFRPYPGFRAFPYPEYSEVFFGTDYKVLRGGSWATDAAASRGTFRNWDYPIRRQIFSGFRTARDAHPDERG
ncbi:ergothioneine biosynthesis protein EgtB [Arthrobacter liuii]|uniref:Hercynine oxygenase n=1 Tax=Arthrobacter liuii TaxID=1476996 RepID=A0ABQ2AYD7_9MICC|nr:ergothioneine biosynthesis protein EgtB [Arthrobacter liuii]GGI02221.1 hercynine oxygenase [Arthrobacter liuii]